MAKAGEAAKGSQVTALTPGQARDAIAAFERLQAIYQSTGRRVSPAKAANVIPLLAVARKDAH